MRTTLQMLATIALLILATGGGVLADAGKDDELRTFEFLTHRIRVLSTDDDQLLFDWSAQRYLAEEARGEDAPSPKIKWVADCDGLIWGTGVKNFAAQWFSQGTAGDHHTFTFFNNEDRKNEGFKFPESTRYMGITDRFVWHGWAWTVMDFYLLEHEDEFPHIWINLADAQQIFLTCASPDDAFERFSRPPDHEGTTDETRRILPDGREQRELTFKPAGGRSEVTLRITAAGANPDAQPAAWRYVYKNFVREESFVFMAAWRETTATSRRALPALPKDTPAVAHYDVERISTVGVRDRTGLGLWPDRAVRYLKVTAGVAVQNFFSSDRGRLLTNGVVFITLLSLLWRESTLHQSKRRTAQ